MNSQTSSSLNKCNNNTIVKLNVGGKLFKTFYSTLSTSTFFQNLLNKDVMESKTIINDGEIFIDRSAILFRDILLFLRTSIIFAFDIDKLNALQLEAEYYQIESMIQAVQASINENSEHKDDHTLLYESFHMISDNIQQKKFFLVEKTEAYTKSYQILDIVNPITYCRMHGTSDCKLCSIKLVLLPKTDTK